MTEVATATATPPAPPAAAVGVPPSAPTGEIPVSQATETPQAPTGETPAKPDEEDANESKRHRRRADMAYRKFAEAKAKAEILEKQLTEERQARQQPQADPSAPKLEQFSDIEKYAEAKAKYESERTLKEHQTKQQAERTKQQEALIVQDWETKSERGADKYDDWQEVVGELKPTTPWAVGIMQVENGEDVAHFLGKNEKEAKRLIGLPPYQQFIEIGRLSEKLAAEPPKPKTPSKAPAPVAALTGASPAVARTIENTNDMKQWIALRNKQLGRVKQ